MVDPAHPEDEIQGQHQATGSRCASSSSRPSNYTELFGKFDFGRFLWNSVFITVVATLITLLFNAMAAFALSKYRFRGQTHRVPADHLRR